MATCLGKLSIRFAVHVFHERLSRASFPFPFGFEGEIWDLIVLVPDRCFY